MAASAERDLDGCCGELVESFVIFVIVHLSVDYHHLTAGRQSSHYGVHCRRRSPINECNGAIGELSKDSTKVTIHTKVEFPRMACLRQLSVLTYPS
jgi:hypothetical protein